MFTGLSNRAFPEVPVVERAALGPFLVGVKGRFFRAPKKKIILLFFFFFFCRIYRFFFLLFLSIHFPFLVTFTLFLPPHDPRHPPSPDCAHVLPLSLPTYPPLLCLGCPSLTPLKPCPARLILLHVSSFRHFSQVSEPPRRPPATVGRATGAPPTP